MHLVAFIADSRVPAVTFFGDRVHDNGPSEPFCLLKGFGEGLEVVTVHWTDVLQTEVFEHALGSQNIFDSGLYRMQRFIDGLSDDRSLAQSILHRVQRPFIGRVEAHGVEPFG